MPLSVPRKVTHTFWAVTLQNVFKMKPTKVGIDERLSLLLSESNVYLPLVPGPHSVLSASAPAELKLRREEGRRIKLAVSRGVCWFGDILAL